MQLIRSIKTLFMLLLFSETILLTPSPITISGNWVDVLPPKPLSAITGDAALYVDITHIVKEFDYEELLRRFPQNTIVAKLIDVNGKEFTLTNSGGFSKTKNEVCVIVSGQGKTPTDVEFKKLQIRSDIELANIKIKWVNGSL